MQQSRFWTLNNGFGIGMRFIVNGRRIDSEGRTTSALVARFRFGVEHSLAEADHSFSASHLSYSQPCCGPFPQVPLKKCP